MSPRKRGSFNLITFSPVHTHTCTTRAERLAPIHRHSDIFSEQICNTVPRRPNCHLFQPPKRGSFNLTAFPHAQICTRATSLARIHTDIRYTSETDLKHDRVLTKPWLCFKPRKRGRCNLIAFLLAHEDIHYRASPAPKYDTDIRYTSEKDL